MPFIASCLTALGRASGTMLSGSGESGPPRPWCWLLVEKHSFFCSGCAVHCGFFINDRHNLGEPPNCTAKPGGFHQKGCWALADAFSASTDRILWFLSVSPLVWLPRWFAYARPACQRQVCFDQMCRPSVLCWDAHLVCQGYCLQVLCIKLR